MSANRRAVSLSELASFQYTVTTNYTNDRALLPPKSMDGIFSEWGWILTPGDPSQPGKMEKIIPFFLDAFLNQLAKNGIVLQNKDHLAFKKFLL